VVALEPGPAMRAPGRAAQVGVEVVDGRAQALPFPDASFVTHAYAVSIHRSQGSEYPCVVLPLTTSAWLMLQRNLLYTAVTRAKQLVVLVGSRRALAKAVRTQGAGRRSTALTQGLRPGPGRAGSG
jgi:exodeoxyribonuclease V alpha subunit